MRLKIIIMYRNTTDTVHIKALNKYFNDYDYDYFKINKYGLDYNDLIYIYNTYNNDFEKDDLLILIDEKSSLSVSPNQLKDIFNHIYNYIIYNIDIFYLSNFMDNCQNKKSLTSSDSINLSHIKFYESKSPKGTFGLVSSFNKWNDIIYSLKEYDEIKLSSKLTNIITNKEIKAGTSWPRIIVPNIDTISDNLENFFTYPCRLENTYHEKKKTYKSTSLYWFFLGCLIVVLFLWFKKFFVN